jgi:hypothetical protein
MMKHAVLSLLAVSLALAGTRADSVCARAEFLLFHRHQNRTWLDSSYALLRQLHQQEPRNEYCTYLWSRIHVQLGDDAASKARKLEFFGKAKAIAETLQRTAEGDGNADAWCWWGVAQGRIGQTRGVLNSLFMVSGLKRAFAKTLELNPQHPTALDAFGVLYYELPGFAGGSLGKSEEYLKRGIEADPTYTLLRLDLAKVHIRQKRWVAARTQLNALLATAKPRYPADTELDDKPEARQLLAQIKDK